MLSREASVEESGSLGKSSVQNKELGRIEEQLRSQEGAATDGLCLYLLGVILAQKCASAHIGCIRSSRTCSHLVNIHEGWPLNLQILFWLCGAEYALNSAEDCCCRSQREESVAVLLQSLRLFPCNWAAWQVLLLTTHQLPQTIWSLTCICARLMWHPSCW